MKYLQVLTLFVFFSLSCFTLSAQEVDTSQVNLSARMDSLGITSQDTWIYISKTKYKLAIMTDSIVLKVYPVVLGLNPVDDKLQQGDRCTPEGTFFIKNKYPHKEWDKFIWIDYPTEDSRRKHNKAKADGIIPKNASIGGEIGIHGVPSDMDYLILDKIDWTHGCISLRNADVTEVFENTVQGTKIVIEQ